MYASFIQKQNNKKCCYIFSRKVFAAKIGAFFRALKRLKKTAHPNEQTVLDVDAAALSRDAMNENLCSKKFHLGRKLKNQKV
jgi:hypothetical protein